MINTKSIQKALLCRSEQKELGPGLFSVASLEFPLRPPGTTIDIYIYTHTSLFCLAHSWYPPSLPPLPPTLSITSTLSKNTVPALQQSPSTHFHASTLTRQPPLEPSRGTSASLHDVASLSSCSSKPSKVTVKLITVTSTGNSTTNRRR